MKRQVQGISSGMHRYTHRCESGVNIHDVFVERSALRVLFSYVGAMCLLANVCRAFLSKESLCLGSFWSVPFSAIVAKFLQYKPVKKESLVIMPAFGIQLEPHFWSGRVHRKFMPIGKILKPVLNECVTPVTCYWSLALLLRDEDETMLVFQPCRRRRRHHHHHHEELFETSVAWAGADKPRGNIAGTLCFICIPSFHQKPKLNISNGSYRMVCDSSSSSCGVTDGEGKRIRPTHTGLVTVDAGPEYASAMMALSVSAMQWVTPA
ncbi:uncharacterized protein LOC123442838 isoform X1 [Hordeum vulgare subsp. vulgare]|uniref:uncharacterized protein LOC123442838 isoform X1 n=1 Tax=Hordeum vulgare subsp. vulgare TaxID=112509 RepID=UPI001D1A3380|nr:uncharacterized protein LOC123442838 isoform X1 [Hordeum vulgare subsp. vulgare]XP_044974930.1 uncharacterized protein LOC123442838 isoform X1 [Hordeum vulgare subsp. vulgare]XP_044974931.1 uncharacterized protein LOC123442838 isoform X1 [Hordeum vulgare subsp. vulgare]XP_044974933.1 uncharacterized protein LOC123442838 isoform X1 [Hordeum vulgare subsp. vulgare]